MHPSADNQKKDQARNLLLNLSRQAESLWSNQHALAKIRRFAPDRLEEFWKRWDFLNNQLRGFLDDLVSWSETREVPREVVFPDAWMRNSVTDEWESLRCRTTEYEDGPDVISAARVVFLLLHSLTQEFMRGSGSDE